MNEITDTTRTLLFIDQRCAQYRIRRDRLRALATEVNALIEGIKKSHLVEIRKALTEVAAAEIALRDAIEQSDASLWQRTRTRVLHGVKIGWQKARGKVVMDDEAKTIERIRQLLPADQAALLIRVRESVHKPAVYDLTAADLRRLAIAIEDDSDQLVLKDIESELDRALEALLAQIAEAEDA